MTSESETEVTNLPSTSSVSAVYVDYQTSKELLRSKVSTESLLFLEESEIAEKIKSLPIEPYGDLPDVPETELDPKNADHVRRKFTRKGKPSEILKMTEDSKTLHLVDNKQTEKLVQFLQIECNRKLQAIEEQDNMNCMLDAVIFQLANKNFIPKKKTGGVEISFGGSQLRKCVIENALVDPATSFNLIKDYITTSFKEYLFRQLSDFEESDYALFILTRYFLDVSTYFKKKTKLHCC